MWSFAYLPLMPGVSMPIFSSSFVEWSSASGSRCSFMYSARAMPGCNHHVLQIHRHEVDERLPNQRLAREREESPAV